MTSPSGTVSPSFFSDSSSFEALERIEHFLHSGWNGSLQKKFLIRFDGSELQALKTVRRTAPF
ncbi:hypothetical protein AB6802_29955 [Mesorhizobium sp. RCC_202]|uniref:hypothetical protein n=1 Tax=Mesorhizobium sp. RCC_202 TaxID=3239222 RepID=UPI001D56662F|nr:hypothetical protein [Mesorhizobium sp.]